MISGLRPVIEIVPVGKVPPELLRALPLAVEPHFPGRIVRLSDRVLPHPQLAFTAGRNQYLSEVILDQLAGVPSRAERVLGVADLDLYTWPVTYIFGQAEVIRPIAVIALARLRPEFDGHPADPTLLRERAIKEAIHELGHTYELMHCPAPTCVMHYSSFLSDTDLKGEHFCAQHRAQLERVFKRAA